MCFRLQDRGFYAVTINPKTQEYSVYLSLADEWQEIIGWTYSPAITPGGWNTLQVKGSGSKFSLWINRWHVADFEDRALTTGKIGIAIGLFNPFDSGVFEFDNFVVKRP